MSSSTFSAKSLLEPSYGSHPTIVTEVQVPANLESVPNIEQNVVNSTCTLWVHYGLPPLLFVDPYELDMRSEEYEITGITGNGAKELEKPVHALPIPEHGLEAGVRLALKRSIRSSERRLEVRLPIHVRYAKPHYSLSNEGSYVVPTIQEPTVALACSKPLTCAGSSNQPLPPLLRKSLSSWPRICVATSTSPAPLAIRVPVGNMYDLNVVEFGTAAVILCCFLWVTQEAWNTSWRLRGRHSTKNKTKKT